MRNIENKIIAAALVALCILMATLVLLTNRVLDKTCHHDEIIPTCVAEVNKTIDEIRQEMDSVSAHYDTTITGAFSDLYERYHGTRYATPDRPAETGGAAAQNKPRPENL